MAYNFPDSPSNGDTFTLNGVTYAYNSAKGVWKDTAVGVLPATVTSSDTAPLNPKAGDLWYRTDVSSLYVYYNDGSSSQWVGVSGPTGATGPTGADGSSVISYANFAAFPTTNNTAGDFGFAQDTKALYMWDGAEWDRVSLGNDESPVITTEPPTTEVALNSDGTTNTVTMVAEDPEGFDITYGIAYKTTNNTRPTQLSADTTINQTTGVYTFTPTTTQADAGTFRARLSASDGARTTTRLVDFNLAFNVDVEYLVVGGGGAGNLGFYNDACGGGGGAGAFITGTSNGMALNSAYTVTVGAGAVAPTTGSPTVADSGSNSVFNTITANGGAGGAGWDGSNSNGGSNGNASGGGAGGAGGFSTGGAGGAYGNNGGNGAGSGTSSDTTACGGGGGAGSAGGNGVSGGAGGNGGDGLSSSITGTTIYYAGGGGGGSCNAGGGAGGNGGGGAGGIGNSVGSAGSPNTGGGGGGGSNITVNSSYAGGDGGSGVVILKFVSSKTATVSAGLTYTEDSTTVSGYKILKMTAGTGTVSFS